MVKVPKGLVEETKAIIRLYLFLRNECGLKEADDWRVKREGADRAAAHYGTQSEAEKAAKEMAANSGGGEVRIHSPKGPIRDSDTVSPGNDPCPPHDKKH